MSSYNFIARFNGNKEVLFNNALKEGQKYNAKIAGDSRAGDFEVMALGSCLKGTYNLVGSEIEISITKKPFFISYKMIESAVHNFIRSQS